MYVKKVCIQQICLYIILVIFNFTIQQHPVAAPSAGDAEEMHCGLDILFLYNAEKLQLLN